MKKQRRAFQATGHVSLATPTVGDDKAVGIRRVPQHSLGQALEIWYGQHLVVDGVEKRGNRRRVDEHQPRAQRVEVQALDGAVLVVEAAAAGTN